MFLAAASRLRQSGGRAAKALSRDGCADEALLSEAYTPAALRQQSSPSEHEEALGQATPITDRQTATVDTKQVRFNIGQDCACNGHHRKYAFL